MTGSSAMPGRPPVVLGKVNTCLGSRHVLDVMVTPDREGMTMIAVTETMIAVTHEMGFARRARESLSTALTHRP